VRVECGGIQRDGDDLLLRAELDQRLTEEMNTPLSPQSVLLRRRDGGHADAIREILDRARRATECATRGAVRWASGDEKNEVVVETARASIVAVSDQTGKRKS